MIMVPGLLVKALNHVYWEVVDSCYEPCCQHNKEYTILYYLVNINTHLEESNEDITEIHNKHNNCTDRQEICAIRN